MPPSADVSIHSVTVHYLYIGITCHTYGHHPKLRPQRLATHIFPLHRVLLSTAAVSMTPFCRAEVRAVDEALHGTKVGSQCLRDHSCFLRASSQHCRPV